MNALTVLYDPTCGLCRRAHEWLAQQNQAPKTAQGARLVRDLRDEAMRTRPLSLLSVPRWAVEWFIPE